MFAVWGDVMALFYAFLLPMTRISACLLTAPVFSALSVNPTQRIAIGLMLTLVIYPLHDWPIIDVMSGRGLVLLAEQIVIGVIMGITLQLAFAAVTAAGEFISMSMGLGFALMADPNSGVQTPVISQFLVLLMTLIFISTGGHLILIEMLLESFRLLPIEDPAISKEIIWSLLSWSIIVFTGAIMIALPAMIILLLINSAMGVVTRAAPSLNIFAVGFPMTLLLGIVVILILLPGFVANMQGLWLDAFHFMRQFLRVA